MTDLHPLAELLARSLGRPAGWATQLCADALGVPTSMLREHPGGSRLNADGSPLEVCVSFACGRDRLRLVAHPGAHLEDPNHRLSAGRAALSCSAAAIGSGFTEHCDALLDLAAGHGAAETSFWMALGLDDAGLALYVDGLEAGRSPWRRPGEIAAAVLPDPRRALQTFDGIAALGALPAGLGVEGRGERGRLKLYFKLTRPVRLELLGDLGFTDPTLLSFLSAVAGGYPLRSSSLVLSTSFDLDRGELCDRKVDVCAHCVPRSGDAWCELLAPWVDSPSRNRYWSVLSEHLRRLAVDVAFVGLGLDRSGASRLNVYVKPKVSAEETVRQAVRRGGEALLSRQDPTGGWRDFSLPVGESTEWVTAVTCLALGRAAAQWRLQGLLSGSARAADWLETHRAYPAGWGFNSKTGPDADSTGFALRALRAHGRSIADADAAFLEAHWHPDGGFRTYDREDGWGRPHSCVTPQAYLALSPQAQQLRLPPVLRAVEDACRDDGSWPAYWWATPFYSTFLTRSLLWQLGLLARRSCRLPIDLTELSTFDLAAAAGLAVAGELSAGPPPERLLGELLRRQLHDGSWPGGAALRVTDPSCLPLESPPRGTVYRDVRGVLTTAWVLYVLSEPQVAARSCGALRLRAVS